ncbi:MAG: glycosyltransferase [Melioribacteraceae bacterium]|nr:glycosyltransferase [Melioribacteraceae bacterium]
MKKVLIITYYWPPAGGPGVQRVLKFVKYLKKNNWQPIVLTVENGSYPAIDETLIKEIPSDCKVYKCPAVEPFGLYKKFVGIKKNEKIPTHVLNKNEKAGLKQNLSRWVRSNVFIPDARIGWINNIVKYGSKIVEEEKPDVIFSSSPPHSLQLGARKLAIKTGVKWIADFRDPWTDGFWQKDLNKSKLSSSLDLSFEKKVLKSADAVIAVGKSMIDLFDTKVKNNYHIIQNGFDETDFNSVIKEESDKFRIKHSGSVRKMQNPKNFFPALKNLIDTDRINKDKLSVEFFGSVHPDILQEIENHNLQDIIRVKSYVPHTKSIENIVNSDLLLLFIPNTPDNKGIITGKIFEYLRTKNTILGLGPKDGDAAEILNNTGCGKMFEYPDNLEDFIFENYRNWLDKKNTTIDDKVINEYSREAGTEKLVSVMNKII